MKKRKKADQNQWFWISMVFLTVLVGHIVVIQIWDITSKNIKPANALDLEVKSPVEISEWLIRRENGICPFDANDFDPADPGKGFRDC